MEKQQQSHEFTAQDYLEKIKESVQIKSNVDTKFYTNETGMDTTVTVQDLSKKRKPHSIGKAVKIPNIKWYKM